MSKARHFSKANLFWNNVAYCDQWKKIMAIYDERSNLRAVIKEADDDDWCYNVLLIGDDGAMLYEFDSIELGSTSKNLKACFEIHCRLQHINTPSYTPSNRRDKRISLHQIFTHSRAGARRTGGFHVTEDNIDKEITEALKRYEEITSGRVNVINCFGFGNCCGYGDYDGYPDVIHEGIAAMYHVGDGIYCDDDGDNWDF